MPLTKHLGMHHGALTAALLVILAASALAARLVHMAPSTFASSAVPSATGIVWEETPWRLPLDNWGEGRVWRASTPGGVEARLFVRTKTGFCNCFSGIADDDEIDRIGDVDLHGDDFRPVAAGRVTALGGLSGRERLFQARSKWGGARHVLSLVAAEDCKAVVATLVSPSPIAPATEASAIRLLTGEDVRRWAAAR